MTFAALVLRSLRFHWRSHLGVLLGATLAIAILVGALAVGDCVRFSLREMALTRLGRVHLALHGRDRFFREALAAELAADLKAPVAPAVLLTGAVSSPGGEARANRVQVLGVGPDFWTLSPGGAAPDGVSAGNAETVLLNARLARKLNAAVGDEVVVRVEKPSLLSRDAPLSTIQDATVVLRVRVAAVVDDSRFGRFGLDANQIPPYNAFLPLRLVQAQVELPERANTLLIGAPASGPAPTLAAAAEALTKRWDLPDAALRIEARNATGELELRTDRIFLDPAVGPAIRSGAPGGRGILTYFVNELRVGDRATPYSTVAALEGAPLPAGMRDDETAINQWLAEDLGAKVGDSLRVKYYVVGPLRQLEERTHAFRIAAILPLAGAAADPTLMPDFPGVAEADNCRDWKPGIPVDLAKIRDRDEAYWDAHRGTPKAFLTLKAGQTLWNNRFGDLTAVRYPRRTQTAETLSACLHQALSPAAIGLFVQPVREQALAAGAGGMDFGQLFVGFSLFLIVAALLLMTLLFTLGIEQRAEEVGSLLAVGFPLRRVQGLLLLEGGALALIGSVLGTLVATAYTQGVLLGLNTVWKEAVVSSVLLFHVEPATLSGGAASGFAAALLSIWLAVRKQGKAPIRELLNAAGAERSEAPSVRRSSGARRFAPGLPTLALCLIAGLGMVAAGLAGDPTQAAGLFFGAGAALLVAGLAACRLYLAHLERGSARSALTVASLGVRGATRRRSRSLAAVALLASGSFLVVAVGANRHDPRDPHLAARRNSGAGGFAFYGETSLPVYQDLNGKEGREAFALEEADLPGVRVVPFRLREGDEASCLNLNRAQTPRLLGVSPRALAERKAFTFGQSLGGATSPWTLLERTLPDGAIPAIGDENTVVWSLGKSLGGTVSYTDEQGNAFPVKIVGVLGNSVLQGSLVISEEHFTRRFPSQSGYRVFLLDAPAEQSRAIGETLTRALEDLGLDLMPAGERLALFGAVENAYLSIFAVLGGLGLLLGSVGLGVVVLRNVLERRGELALLRAVGFRPRTVQWLVFSEHSLLLLLGLGVGIATALLAVLPALRSPGAEIPIGSLAVTLLGVLLCGILCTAGATAGALRGPLFRALRNE